MRFSAKMSSELKEVRVANHPTVLLDPEYVIPSPASAQTTEFWDRMLTHAENRDPRLGPSTMAALLDLAESPPAVIAQNDFWRILGQYSSRGLSPQLDKRTICDHLVAEYQPDMGAPDNLLRLTTDLAATGANAKVQLSTLAACWAMRGAGCTDCSEPALFLEDENVDEEIHLRNAAQALRASVLDEDSSNLQALEEHSFALFPHLTFHAGAWSRIGSLQGSASEAMSGLLLHLGVLSDAAIEIWSTETETTSRQAALRALGVVASPENGRTHRNRAAMAERDFEFAGETVRCEWHTKLRPNVNRVYFSVGKKTVEVDGGYDLADTVYVGVITDHLSN